MAADGLENLAFVCQTKSVLAKINEFRNANYNHLRPAQFQCIKSALETDTIGVLPTGYGKSLIFEAIPYFQNSSVIVISPLNSIIEEQLNRYGHKAVHLNEMTLGVLNSDLLDIPDNSVNLTALSDCSYSYVIGHPEQFITKPAFSLFKTDVWQKKISHIIIDEAHCVVQWGVGFREKFTELSKLRSMFPSAKVLALTATSTIRMQDDIKKQLCLKSCNVISFSVDRPNIKLEVKERPSYCGGKTTVQDSYDYVLKPLVEELRDKRLNFPKTVVYTKLKWCGYGYEEALRPLENGAELELEDLVSQYHSPCTPQMRNKVLKSMADPEGDVKLLFATEAYSMGTDAPDIRRVVHAGVPTTLETYVQEIGRSGRDGKPSVATLYFNKSDISANVPGMTEEMRDFCTLDSCRRDYISKHFGFESESEIQKHECCDNCGKKCVCIECCMDKDLFHDEVVENSNDTAGEQDQMNNDIINSVYETMKCYFDAENESLDIPNSEIYTGLSDKFAKQISLNYWKFKCTDTVIKENPIICEDVAENIIIIIQEVERSL